MIERSRVRVPAGAAGEFSFPESTVCVDSYFGIRSTPVLPSVARKRARSICQKCRRQVTAKHARTLRDVVHGCMVYTERAETAAASPPPPCDIQTAL